MKYLESRSPVTDVNRSPVIKHPSIKIVHLHGPPTQSPSPSNFDDTSSDKCRYYVVKSDDALEISSCEEKNNKKN